MAAAISQVALTIGRENTTSDLVDPYIEFLRDSEVVKIEALKNMAAFIKVVDPSKHEHIINQLQQILIPAKKIMWRFRETLGYQIVELIKIYEKINKVYCLPYLIGLALRLMVDRYDCVRKVGVEAFIEGFKRIDRKVEVLKFFRDVFAHNICWKRRQLYILTVDKMLATDAISSDMFNDHILEYLLNLSTHSVPNIRLYAGRCLSTTVLMHDYFKEETLHEMIGVRVFELAHDSDRDVRDNTTLAYISKEVLKLAEMVTKFDEAKLDDAELDKPLDRWSTENLRCTNDPFELKDEPEPLLPPLPDNENLPTLSWAVPTPSWDHVVGSNKESSTNDVKDDSKNVAGNEVEESGKNLRKGFKFLFGTLDLAGSAEPGEQIDVAEEATTSTVKGKDEDDVRSDSTTVENEAKPDSQKH